eukprot:COSAG02_NODE_4379_length_5427_cov_7.176989_2_plen_195_part_00
MLVRVMQIMLRIPVDLGPLMREVKMVPYTRLEIATPLDQELSRYPRVAAWPAGGRTDDACRMMPLQLPGIAAAKAASRHAVVPCHDVTHPSAAWGVVNYLTEEVALMPGAARGRKACEIGLPQRRTSSELSQMLERVDLPADQASFVRCIYGVDKRQESTEDACRPCDRRRPVSRCERKLAPREKARNKHRWRR